MSRIEARIEALGLKLPAPMLPPGNFKLVNVHGDLAYVAGPLQSTARRFSFRVSSVAI